MFLRAFGICLLIFAPFTFGASPPAPVFVKKVVLEPFADSIEALGTLKSNEEVTLSSTVTETISAVHFEDGQEVPANKILVEMTSSEEHALLEEAQSAVDETKHQYERVKSLAKSNLTSGSLLDERLQAYQAASARLQATQSRLVDRLILAPFAGVVGLRNISVGKLVRPGDAITTLDDINTMKLDISVPAVFLESIKVGTTVVAKTRELSDKPFSGTVSAIDSRIDPSTRSINVRARIPNRDHLLKPGMLMMVSLQKAVSQRILIPEEALVREGFNSYVYRINSGSAPLTVSKIEVQSSARRLGAVVVDSGINEGDVIVTHGIMRLRNGSPVTIKAEQKGGENLSELLQQKKAGAQK